MALRHQSPAKQWKPRAWRSAASEGTLKRRSTLSRTRGDAPICRAHRALRLGHIVQLLESQGGSAVVARRRAPDGMICRIERIDVNCRQEHDVRRRVCKADTNFGT